MRKVVMKRWNCDQCKKDLSNYKNLWRHKKTCKAAQRVLCTKCSKIMGFDDYKRHIQTCTSPQRFPKDSDERGESSREKIYKELGDTANPETQILPSEEQTHQPEFEITDESEDDMSTLGEASNNVLLPSEEENEFEITDEWKNEDNSSTKSVNNELDSDDEAEDIEDKQMDSKIWNAITTWCRKSETDALEGFKFWYEFCQKLEHDPAIKKIMETVHAFRDQDDTLSFKEALDRALMKRKYLIYETLRVFKTEGIWKILLEEPDNGMDVFQLLKKYILACRSMKRDKIFISVREMIEDSMEAVDEMDFEEALNHSIEAKADEIFEAVGELPRRDTASHVWDRISKTFNPLMPDPDSEVRYFINMQLLIEEDETFQTVLARINKYLENGDTLDFALYNSVKENELMIRESFARGRELWNAMKADEFGDEKEELDVFKTYVLYYLGLKHDELFQSIMDKIQRLIQDGWKYNDALNHTLQWKMVDIRNTIGHPWIPGLRYLVNLRPPR